MKNIFTTLLLMASFAITGCKKEPKNVEKNSQVTLRSCSRATSMTSHSTIGTEAKKT